MMIIVSAVLTTKPGMREKVLGLAQPCIAATLSENGCLQYELLRSTNDENVLVFVERWESLETLRAHSQSAHVAAFREARKDFMESAAVKVYEANEISM